MLVSSVQSNCKLSFPFPFSISSIPLATQNQSSISLFSFPSFGGQLDWAPFGLCIGALSDTTTTTTNVVVVVVAISLFGDRFARRGDSLVAAVLVVVVNGENIVT